MASLSLPTMLQPHIVNERISRIRVFNTVLQDFTGMGQGGANVRRSPMGRRGAYDVFNDTRQVPVGTFPGSTAAVIAANPVGVVNFTIPRVALNLPLKLEDLANYRPIGGPVSAIDIGGELYIAEQERIRKEYITNFREFQIASMFRGSYTYSISMSGEITHSFSGGQFTVNYRIPSGNLNQLNMLGAGSIIDAHWATTTTLISTHLSKIDAAFVQLTGRGLRHLWVNSNTWQEMLSNTQLQAQAGTVNQVFEYMQRDESNENFTARLKAVPWLTIHITNQGVCFGPNNTSFTKIIPDNSAVFMTEWDSSVATLWECSEPVVEEWNGRRSDPVGEYHYYEPKGNPAVYQGFSLYNGLPVLKIPACIAFGTVDGF